VADLKAGFNPLFLREDDLREGMELLSFANRDVLAEADAILARQGLGRAHHRALYFIGRHPGVSVSELLQVLRVTKQSLSRVLSDLTARALVSQTPGLRDRRRRHLALTPEGQELERALTERQRALLARAYRQAGAEAVQGFRKVLAGMISDADRRLISTVPTDDGKEPTPARTPPFGLGRAGAD
jgi:DNA-binding MarR family transcriptional regulator